MFVTTLYPLGASRRASAVAALADRTRHDSARYLHDRPSPCPWV